MLDLGDSRANCWKQGGQRWAVVNIPYHRGHACAEFSSPDINSCDLDVGNRGARMSRFQHPIELFLDSRLPLQYHNQHIMER
jgi:hypothetical protein